MTWEAVIETVQKFWLQFFLTGLSGAIVMLWKKINESRKEQKKEEEVLKNAVKALLLDRVYQASEHFLDAGFISDISLKMLTKLYSSYVNLGDGDQAIGLIIEDVKKLPKQLHSND